MLQFTSLSGLIKTVVHDDDLEKQLWMEKGFMRWKHPVYGEGLLVLRQETEVQKQVNSLDSLMK